MRNKYKRKRERELERKLTEIRKIQKILSWILIGAGILTISLSFFISEYSISNLCSFYLFTLFIQRASIIVIDGWQDDIK